MSECRNLFGLLNFRRIAVCAVLNLSSLSGTGCRDGDYPFTACGMTGSGNDVIGFGNTAVTAGSCGVAVIGAGRFCDNRTVPLVTVFGVNRDFFIYNIGALRANLMLRAGSLTGCGFVDDPFAVAVFACCSCRIVINDICCTASVRADIGLVTVFGTGGCCVNVALEVMAGCRNCNTGGFVAAKRTSFELFAVCSAGGGDCVSLILMLADDFENSLGDVSAVIDSDNFVKSCRSDSELIRDDCAVKRDRIDTPVVRYRNGSIKTVLAVVLMCTLNFDYRSDIVIVECTGSCIRGVAFAVNRFCVYDIGFSVLKTEVAESAGGIGFLALVF